MSYEGREVFICENGHVHYENWNCGYYEEPKTCEFCGTSFRFVGSIDDTNGEAAASFRLKTINEEEIQTEIKDGCKIIKIKPGVYEIEDIGHEFCNFDTGEIKGWSL